MISKGEMVQSQTVNLANQVGQLSFIPNFDFAPTTQVICYFYDDNGMIQSQSVSINLQDSLPNFVRIIFINFSLSKLDFIFKARLGIVIVDSRTGNKFISESFERVEIYCFTQCNWSE